MPGRYSHSVVLAGYSSQGIINLPNDKHIEYMRNAPVVGPPRVRSNSNIRSGGPLEPHQRSQSAMAVRSGRWTPASDAISSQTRRYFIDGDSHHPASKVNLLLNTTPTYKPRRSIDAQQLDRELPSTPRSQSALGIRTQPAPELPVRSAQREVQRSASSASQSELRIPLNRSSSEIRIRAANAAAALLQRAAARNNNSTTRASPSDTSINSTELKRNERPRQSHLRHSTSNVTMQTQIYDPISEQDEPNFDGFSDTHESQDSYFSSASSDTMRKSERTDEIDHQERIRNPENLPSPNIMSRSRQSYELSFNSTSSTNPSEHNRTLPSESSDGKLHSLSSLSSFNSTNVSANHRFGKSSDAKKSTVQSPVEQWGLPEIEENRVFEPEIFAQDLAAGIHAAPSTSGFGESTFGMISSGRDVDFTADDDTFSDAASACPPDIGRYRDEEETAPSQQLSRVKNDDVRAPSPGLQSNKSKKGFLSRLKAKRSWM